MSSLLIFNVSEPLHESWQISWARIYEWRRICNEATRSDFQINMLRFMSWIMRFIMPSNTKLASAESLQLNKCSFI